MKLYNINTDGGTHLAAEAGGSIRDLTAAGFEYEMDDIISGKVSVGSSSIEKAPAVTDPVYANVVNHPGKLVCVGLNYLAHAKGINLGAPQEHPVLFSKFSDALAPAGEPLKLAPWETSYDYEAELVIVMGKTAWGVSEAEADDYIFGYTCGNDFSCRDPQMRSSQWLIGKTMPGFGPCGPCIVTKDEYDPYGGMAVKSYVNGQLRQDGTTADMIFSCRQIVSYASHYMRLEPGDLIFTGTPSGVALEKAEKTWLKAGDTVTVELEGIGKLTTEIC